MGRNRKQRLKKRHIFSYNNGTWEALCKIEGVTYAIEVNKKMIAAGPILRFKTKSNGDIGEIIMTGNDNDPATEKITCGNTNATDKITK